MLQANPSRITVRFNNILDSSEGIMLSPTYNLLERVRRRRIFAVLASLLVVFLLGQMVIFNGGKKVQAGTDRSERGVTRYYDADGVTTRCDIFGTDYIPAICEGAEIHITSAGTVVNADQVTVWDDASTSEDCPSADAATGTVGTYKFDFLNPVTHKCYYEYDTSTDKLGYYRTLQTEHTNARKARYDACVTTEDRHGRISYVLSGDCSVSAYPWGVKLMHSVSDYTLFYALKPNERVPDYADEALPNDTSLLASTWDGLTWTNLNAYNYNSNTSVDSNGCQKNIANQDYPTYNTGSYWANLGYSSGMCYYARQTNMTRWSNIVKTVDSTQNIGHTTGDACSIEVAKTNQHCNTKRTFKSLSIEGGAVLTHHAVTVDDMLQDLNKNKSLADETIGLARLKKVDLVVTGDVTIEAGSRIDATNRGYPGANPGTLDGNSDNGYGRGGGIGQPCTDKGNCQGSGAGYGGKGRDGSEAQYPGGATYDEDLSDFDFGSGGGGAKNTDSPTWYWFGGSGGGRVRIDAGAIVLKPAVGTTPSGKIVANGWGGINNAWSEYTRSQSGGGSGGSIVIKIKQQSADSYFVSAGTESKYAGTGTVKLVGASVQNTDLVLANISAGGGGNDDAANTNTCPEPNGHGGLCGGLSGKGGGGGRIYIEKAVSPAISVKKVLVPEMRNGITVTPTTKFNPYALQVNDIIRVEIYLGSYFGTTDLKDEFMKTSAGAKCAYYSYGSYGPDPTPSSPVPTTASASISWSGLSSGTYAATSAGAGAPIVYYCKIQK